MEKVLFLIMSRQKDSFNIIYAGDCEQTSDNDFFKKHPSFDCWNEFDKLPYLAILPMFESDTEQRKRVLDQIVICYRPKCNTQIKSEIKPDYKTRSKSDSQNTPQIICPCCGSNMKADKVYENTTVFRCVECGLSDTKLNS